MPSLEARQAYNDRLALELKAKPNHPRHGTTTAYRAGCRCIGPGSCSAANAAAKAAQRRR